MPSRIQAVTQTAGEALNAFCGAQMTRLTVAAKKGDTAFWCERLDGWAQSGEVQVGGIAYAYANRTDTYLSGLSVSTPNGTLTNVQADCALGAAVVDASRNTSYLDLLRRSIFVDTALGDDLTVLGRNLGVARQAALTGDDHYRQIIKAMAYNPRGTVYGLELALDAMLGPGNYQVVENFVAYPATVEVNLRADTFLASAAQGQTYVDGQVSVVPQSPTEVDLPASYLSVTGLHLKDDRLYVDCRTAKPSAATVMMPGGASPAFAFVGDETKVQLVQLGAGAGATQITNATGYYLHKANVQPDSTAYATCVFGIPPTVTLPTTDARTFALRLCDGAYSIGVGCVASGTAVGLGLCNPLGTGTGALVSGVAATFAKGQVVDVALEKVGRTTVNLRLNGKLVQSAPLAAFPQNTTPTFDFGALGGAAGNGCVRFVGLHTHTATDYMGTQSQQGARMAGTVLTDPKATFQPKDTAKPIRIYGSTAKNAAGGTNNGAFWATYQSDTSLVLTGRQNPTGAQVDSGTGKLTVTGQSQAFAYPDDLGKTVTVYNSNAGNNGTYVIASILQNGTGRDYSTFASPLKARGNTCVLAGASFAQETDIGWSLNPAGITENGLSYNLSGTASVVTSTPGHAVIVPETPLPYPGGVYSAQATAVYSAIVVDSELPVVRQVTDGTPPTFNVAPAYVSDTSNFARAYLTDLVAAGVRLKFNYV